MLRLSHRVPTLLAAALFAACGEGSTVPDDDHHHVPKAEPPKEQPPKEQPPKEEPPPEPPPRIEGIPYLVDENIDPRIVEVSLVAKASSLAIADGPETDLWTYNDSLPGPLIHARVGDRVIVHFDNQLADPTVVHWHGLRISDQMDGSPRIQSPVAPGGSFTYDFIVPDAGTFWYHTHFNQIEQFERGLYGALVVHERDEPKFTSERVIVIDDIRLDSDNQIAPFLTSGPDIGAGRVGNTLLANGKAEPLRTVLPRGGIERWRVILANNALTMGLRLKGAQTRVIATDGGLLPSPLEADRVEIAPGQRYDFEVRAGEGESEVTLEALIFVIENDQVVEKPFPLAIARVEGDVAQPEPKYPEVILPAVNVAATEVAWKLAATNAGGKVEFTINGQSGYVDGHEHPLLGTFPSNEPVRIRISSSVSPAHPFHIHGQFFQIVERGGKPVTDEPGLRDTVAIRGAESASVLTYFENPGRWMVHCHISEHSEKGMMAEVVVTDSGAGSSSSSSSGGGHSH